MHPPDEAPHPVKRRPRAEFFQRLYRRDQREHASGQWTATDLMECPVCCRVILVPVKEGGGRRPHCGHQPGWSELFAEIHGPEVRPPKEEP